MKKIFVLLFCLSPVVGLAQTNGKVEVLKPTGLSYGEAIVLFSFLSNPSLTVKGADIDLAAETRKAIREIVADTTRKSILALNENQVEICLRVIESGVPISQSEAGASIRKKLAGIFAKDKKGIKE